jgi:O-methyltransferase
MHLDDLRKALELRANRYVRDFNTWAKFAVVASPLRLPRLLASVDQLFRLRDYVRSSGLLASPYFSSRYQLYDHVHQTIVGESPIDYLEFGVFTGMSMRHWVSLNKCAGSRFVGFDTFEGLPERWAFATGSLEAGYFSTGGNTPDIRDPRVRFIKGLFQDTVGKFARDFQPQRQLVVHCDADLYSSTLYVLATLHEFLQPGTIVIFDEFGTVNEEFRAVMDYTRSFRRHLAPVGWAGRFYEHVAFRVQEFPNRQK